MSSHTHTQEALRGSTWDPVVMGSPSIWRDRGLMPFSCHPFLMAGGPRPLPACSGCGREKAHRRHWAPLGLCGGPGYLILKTWRESSLSQEDLGAWGTGPGPFPGAWCASCRAPTLCSKTQPTVGEQHVLFVEGNYRQA
jgi:hypothetical protein